ncbi:MAG TPA: hypothetical protein VGK93_00160 [Candidatus Eisenbacteria bacterium]|jgi:hypothetical protein
MHFNLRSAIPVAMAAGLAATLALSTVWSVTADDDDGGEGRCSNRTLRGDYGFDIGGQILTGPLAGNVLRGVAMTHFDGHGNLTQVDFATFNGVPGWPDWRPATGTYDLNPDCTGTAEIIPSDQSPSLHLRMVVVDRGREIRTIVEGNATGSTGIKVR